MENTKLTMPDDIKPGLPAAVEEPPIRVVVLQDALPRYRQAVYRALSQRPGLDFKLIYGDIEELKSESPQGFSAEAVPIRKLHVLGRRLMWHSPHMEYATRDRADVLCLVWNLNFLSLVPALLKAHRNGVGTVVWGHGFAKPDKTIHRWLRRQVAKLADAVMFYNKRMADLYAARGMPRQKLFWATNTLDESAIEKAKQPWLQNAALLEKWQREMDLFERSVVLFVSRLWPKCRPDMLLRAVSRLVPQMPDLRLVMIGGGTIEELKALAQQLGIAQNVRFTGPVYDEEQLAPWFLSAHVLPYPHRVGLSLIHAFSYGVPVVASDNTPMQGPEIDALRDGENGLLFRDGDEDDFCEKIRRILTDEPLRRRMGAEALRTVKTEYNLKQMVDGFERAIRYAADCTREQRLRG